MNGSASPEPSFIYPCVFELTSRSLGIVRQFQNKRVAIIHDEEHDSHWIPCSSLHVSLFSLLPLAQWVACRLSKIVPVAFQHLKGSAPTIHASSPGHLFFLTVLYKCVLWSLILWESVSWADTVYSCASCQCACQPPADTILYDQPTLFPIYNNRSLGTKQRMPTFLSCLKCPFSSPLSPDLEALSKS